MNIRLKAKPLLKLLFAISFFSLMTACSTNGLFKSEQPPERVYWLLPLLVDSASKANSTNVTGIDLPTISVDIKASPGLDTNKILILEPDARLNHYASARWPENISEVLDSLLRNSMESSGNYSKVSQENRDLLATQKLNLEIREFYTLIDNTNTARSVRMTIQGYINCRNRDHKIKLFSDVAVSDNRLSKIVIAYQDGINSISQQLLDQLDGVCG